MQSGIRRPVEPLNRFKRRTDLARSAIAAPFSRKYRTRLRWMEEEPQWRLRGIPQTHVTKSLLYIEQTGAFYIPVPKAGNTSILTAIAKSSTAAVGGACPDISRLPNVLDIGCGPEDFRSGARLAFTIVRHPVSRFWSAYTDKIVRRPQGAVASRVRHALRIGAGKLLTADHLLDYVEGLPAADIDRHFRPQYAICAAEVLPVRIGRLENLAADLSRLANEFCFPRESLKFIGVFNSSNSREVHESNRRTDRRVAEIYERDLAALGY
jgi:Sulfotransferase family